jgi:hypothetical protein
MLKSFFVLVLMAMIGVSTWASLQSNVIEGFRYVIADRWGVATLFDTYFSFLTIYLWIAYKHRSGVARAVWLVLILTLGSIAFSVFILRELARSKTVEEFLCQTR